MRLKLGHSCRYWVLPAGRALSFWLAGLFAALCYGQKAPALVAGSGSVVPHGESPRLAVTGVAPKETVVIHSFRMARAYGADRSQSTPVLAHAFAELVADSKGTINVDQAVPLRGTYGGADPLGLLWSGEKSIPVDDVKLSSEDEVLFRLERKSRVVAETRITLNNGEDRVEIEEVKAVGLNGAFAQPRNGSSPYPAIILLTGSGGGTVGGARALAARFAQLGYGAFALNYFANPSAHIEGVPQDLVEIPVETVDKARAWLRNKPNVDAERVALWGLSKGAEFALVAAAHYEWVDRVVACVPSSLVWDGFTPTPPLPAGRSSWSFQGRPLPFVPYDRDLFEDSMRGKLSGFAMRQRSLERVSESTLEAARIPVEKIRATLLLLGAGNDEVWPSGDMVRRIEDELRRAGHSNQVSALVFEGASHVSVFGVGDEMTRINPIIKPEGGSPTPDACARAAAKAWAETKRFLERP